MGATTCAAVLAAPDLELVAAVDPSHAGRSVAEVLVGAGLPVPVRVPGGPGFSASTPPERSELFVASSADAFAENQVEVAVDFTVAPSARGNIAWCAAHGVHAVVGTTGFHPDELVSFADLFANGKANAIIAPNFSIGAVMMMRCAELCAPHFQGVEIIELHHENKRDAPSGTSLTTAHRIEAARTAANVAALSPDPTEIEILRGARGGETGGGIHVHAIRLPGFVAHQQVIFGSVGETLTLRHDSTDRVSFMAGVLLAVRGVAEHAGLTVGLDAYL
jgi:4-hydroxy-tetrahydrodipicolinate reductase